MVVVLAKDPSVRLSVPEHITEAVASAVRRYRGPKLLFIQDEYEGTHANQAAIRDLGIRLVFTCVPTESIAKVYPPALCPGVTRGAPGR